MIQPLGRRSAVLYEGAGTSTTPINLCFYDLDELRKTANFLLLSSCSFKGSQLPIALRLQDQRSIAQPSFLKT